MTITPATIACLYARCLSANPQPGNAFTVVPCITHTGTVCFDCDLLERNRSEIIAVLKRLPDGMKRSHPAAAPHGLPWTDICNSPSSRYYGLSVAHVDCILTLGLAIGYIYTATPGVESNTPPSCVNDFHFVLLDDQRMARDASLRESRRKRMKRELLKKRVEQRRMNKERREAV